MNIDLRRFAYALEPLRSQRKWQLDALLARLGRAQLAVQEAEKQLAGMREGHRVLGLELARNLARGVDPAQCRMGLLWMANLNGEIRGQEETLCSLQAERSQIRARCQAHQHKVEVLDEHRAGCVNEFAQEEAGRQATEADREWSTRDGSHSAMNKARISGSRLRGASGSRRVGR